MIGRAWSRLLGTVIVLILLVPPLSLAYEVETHDTISQAALRASSAGSRLQGDQGIDAGITHEVDGRMLVNWIGIGSRREDDIPRFLNHFHNPLRMWDAAGFRVPWPFLGLQVGLSSILWQQDTEHSGWS